MGNLEQPVAITGVGLDLKDITEEFAGYKFGTGSSLWLIDQNGKIHLADDLNCRGMNKNHSRQPAQHRLPQIGRRL